MGATAPGRMRRLVAGVLLRSRGAEADRLQVGLELVAGHPLRTQTWTFDQFVAACGAEGELEAVCKVPAKQGTEAVPAGK